jgi:hypothetical protein
MVSLPWEVVTAVFIYVLRCPTSRRVCCPPQRLDLLGEFLAHLDEVVKTLYLTVKDMSDKNKETSQGGLGGQTEN